MDREQRIREIAYDIWVGEGHPVDQEERHWRMAEMILAKEEAGSPTEQPSKEPETKPGAGRAPTRSAA